MGLVEVGFVEVESGVVCFGYGFEGYVGVVLCID